MIGQEECLFLSVGKHGKCSLNCRWYMEIKQVYIQLIPITCKNAQVVTNVQTSCNKVVVKPISGCVRTACSQLLWQVWDKLLSSCYKVDDSNRLATSCSNKTNTGFRNKLLRACWHQLVNNLLSADDIRLVGKNSLRAVDKLCSHCLFLVVVTSLEQAVNNM
jgi:hypothetical protein